MEVFDVEAIFGQIEEDGGSYFHDFMEGRGAFTKQVAKSILRKVLGDQHNVTSRGVQGFDDYYIDHFGGETKRTEYSEAIEAWRAYSKSKNLDELIDFLLEVCDVTFQLKYLEAGMKGKEDLSEFRLKIGWALDALLRNVERLKIPQITSKTIEELMIIKYTCRRMMSDAEFRKGKNPILEKQVVKLYLANIGIVEQ